VLPKLPACVPGSTGRLVCVEAGIELCGALAEAVLRSGLEARCFSASRVPVGRLQTSALRVMPRRLCAVELEERMSCRNGLRGG
jgi:hypothetical protein